MRCERGLVILAATSTRRLRREHVSIWSFARVYSISSYLGEQRPSRSSVVCSSSLGCSDLALAFRVFVSEQRRRCEFV